MALVLQIIGADDEDDRLTDAAQYLRTELLALDVDAVEPLDNDNAPDRAKGLGSLLGWLGVQLGAVENLRVVINALRGWAARNNRVVEIGFGDDTLRLTGLTAAQQERLIEEFLERHRSDF